MRLRSTMRLKAAAYGGSPPSYTACVAKVAAVSATFARCATLPYAPPHAAPMLLRSARCMHCSPPIRHTSVLTHHRAGCRSEEHTSELQSLLRISDALLCLALKKVRIVSVSDTTNAHTTTSPMLDTEQQSKTLTSCT